ncbi:MAG: hypothetical protein J7539_18010 [Niabella sp.]|nr:hypothetical protein [Niabella sp.]
MPLLTLVDFVGRFHPVLVHLPIGILLIACLFQLFVRRFPSLKPAVPVMLFWGMLAAIASCVTGYLLSLSGDYEQELVTRHQWLGIITAIAALLCYGCYRFSLLTRYSNIMAGLTIGAVTVTGHLGGSLTHGADYLTAGLNSVDPNQPLKPIPNIQEAVLYTAVVQPILQRKCYSCHGSTKQKGRLRLDKEPYIVKGGKDGKILASGKPDESALVKRLLLPLSDDDHMPPKEKPQLTPNEVDVLSWWISTGNSFTKKIKELPQTDKIKPVLVAFQSGTDGPKATGNTYVPNEDVSAPDLSVVTKLTDNGVIVVPVSNDKNYVSVNFVTATAKAAALIRLLEPLKKQIVWLKLDNSNITDESLKTVAAFTNLTRLYLSNTAVTDAGIAQLNTLKQLQVLNLVGTKITQKGLEPLRQLKTLRELYLYQTAINRNNWAQLKQAFPKVVLDSGGYVVPTLETDTTLVAAPQKK